MVDTVDTLYGTHTLGPNGQWVPVPATPAPEQFRPTIDVGPRVPNARPGEFGSGQTPARPMPEVVVPAPPAPPAAPPPFTPPETPPPPPQAPAPAVPPPAPTQIAPPAATPPAPSVAPPAGAPARPGNAPVVVEGDTPYGGFVRAPDGRVVTPEEHARTQPITPVPGAFTPPEPPAITAPPAAIPASVANQEVRAAPKYGSWQGQGMQSQPWYQDLWDKSIGSIGPGMQELIHQTSIGYDETVLPIPDALRLSLTEGIPFTQAYEQVKREMQGQRKAFEYQNPVGARVAEGAGMLIDMPPLAKLYAPTRINASRWQRAKDVGRNIGANVGIGGVTGFGMSEGDLNERINAAYEGAKTSALLGLAAPVAGRTVQGVYRSLTPGRQIDRKVGEELLGQAGGTVPTMEQPAIPNFPLGVGGASNRPGLAAQERRANTLDDAAAQQQRVEQNAAIRAAATTYQPGFVRLAGPEAPPAQASARYVQALRAAWNVFRTEANRRWSTPNIVSKPVDWPELKRSVQADVDALSDRDRRLINRTPAIQDIITDFAAAPHTGTLADVNQYRSELLEIARTNPDATVQRVAGNLAQTVLTAIESNPALRSDPAAWRDYVRARQFTADMWSTDALGHPVFQNMIKAGSDEARAGSLMFRQGGIGERVQQGTARGLDMLDDIRRQWGALGLGGPTGAASFPPGVAFAARAELAQGARDFIIHSMLDAATSTTRDLAGNPNFILNSLSTWIRDNRQWIRDSRLFNQDQLDLIDRIGSTAIQGARVENLRGGRGAETYERLMGGKPPKLVDFFASPFTKASAQALGGLAGAWVGGFGEGGIGYILGGGFLGGRAEEAGTALLERLYRVPEQTFRDRFNQAIRDPQIAEDLMRNVDPQNMARLSARTKNWMRALLAEGVGRTEAGLADEHQPSATLQLQNWDQPRAAAP